MFVNIVVVHTKEICEMKSKIFVATLVFVVTLMLSGCKLKREVTDSSNLYRLITVEPNGVVYVEGPYRLAPYYSPNGKMCHMIDGRIEEID